MSEGIKGASEGPSMQPIQPAGGGPTKGAGQAGMQTQVRTLDDVKNALISALGEEKGKKMYNQFLRAFAETMLSQIRSTAESAKQATKKMGGG